MILIVDNEFNYEKNKPNNYGSQKKNKPNNQPKKNKWHGGKPKWWKKGGKKGKGGK